MAEASVVTTRVRTVRPTRLLAQILLAAVAIFLFAWLINVLANHPDNGTGGMAEGSWVALLLVLLVINLVAMILMTDTVYDRLRGVGKVPVSDERSLVIGCPACGTVFSKPISEYDEQHEFQCDNCGRQGFIRDHSLNRKWIRNEHCNTCGFIYQEYKEYSECPSCHTYNEY